MGNQLEPIGQVQEFSGSATIKRTDGSVEDVTLGTEVFQGDIVETSADGAVNIVFTDESSFAVSEDASLTIDEYVFDPTTDEGAQNFSVLKGLFVYTSGLVGRDDPDDVTIETPSGSIGIRGTIIAGDAESGEVTVVEGAIVLRDHDGNEMTLASQYETGKFEPGKGISNQGQMSANDVNARFSSISKVSPTLFSSVNDTAAEAAPEAAKEVRGEEQAEGETQQGESGEEAGGNADGSVDQNGDNQVDGSVEEVGEGPGEGPAAEAGEPMGDAPADMPVAEAMPEGPKMVMMDMAKDMMGEAMDAGMSRGEAQEATMEAMMDQMQEMQEMREQMKEMMEEAQEAAEETAGEGGEGEKLGPEGPETNEIINPELLGPPPENTGPVETFVDIGSLATAGTAPIVGFHMADGGGVTYVGTSGVDLFTNVEEGGSVMHHQDFSVETGDGNDELYFENLMAAVVTPEGPLAAGSLRLRDIETGDGDDIIDLDMSNSFIAGTSAFEIDVVDGGVGIDQLRITGNADLDFAGIAYLTGIEEIHTENPGASFQNLNFTEEQLTEIIQGSDDVESITLDGGSTYDNFNTLRIFTDNTLDDVTADLSASGEWLELTGSQRTDNGVGTTESYYYNSTDDVLLIVDNGAAAAPSIMIV